jgi:hypothetical protein
MSRRQPTGHGRPTEPDRLSFSELREVARRRAAMREATGEGVTRRDFVRAGAAAAVAAATSQAAVAAGPDPQVALTECMNAMKKAAATAAAGKLPFARGVEAELEKLALPKFVEHIAGWEAIKPKVTRAAAGIGTIAATLAQINESPVIGRDHLKAAVKDVRENCKARGVEDARFVFCPMLE